MIFFQFSYLVNRHTFIKKQSCNSFKKAMTFSDLPSTDDAKKYFKANKHQLEILSYDASKSTMKNISEILDSQA